MFRHGGALGLGGIFTASHVLSGLWSAHTHRTHPCLRNSTQPKIIMLFGWAPLETLRFARSRLQGIGAGAYHHNCAVLISDTDDGEDDDKVENVRCGTLAVSFFSFFPAPTRLC